VAARDDAAVGAGYEPRLDQDAILLCPDTQLIVGPHGVLKGPGRNEVRVEPSRRTVTRTGVPSVRVRDVRHG
jgi:hypothetical protein